MHGCLDHAYLQCLTPVVRGVLHVSLQLFLNENSPLESVHAQSYASGASSCIEVNIRPQLQLIDEGSGIRIIVDVRLTGHCHADRDIVQ